MNISKRLLLLFIWVNIVACGQRIRLSNDDISWMPYKGNETLIFKSNEGELDTMFFLRKDTLWGLPDPQLSKTKYEIVSIFSKHSAHSAKLGGKSNWANYFVQIRKTKSKRAEIEINLQTKDAMFYRLNKIKLDSLSKVEPKILFTSYGNYNDVYVIEAEDYLGTLSDRPHFVNKLYWSKSKGLVRYDKRDSIKWELMK